MSVEVNAIIEENAWKQVRHLVKVKGHIVVTLKVRHILLVTKGIQYEIPILRRDDEVADVDSTE